MSEEGRSKSPRQRERRERFVALAEKRVGRVLQDLRLVGNLASRSNYVNDDEDLRQIFRAIDEGVRSMKQRFRTERESQRSDFRLDR